MSDVPLGAYLSGGIDSSIVVALMAGCMDKPVKIVCIGFQDAEFNELPYARQIAERFGTDHYELIVEPDAINDLPRLVRHFDEPFGDPAALPTWYLSETIRAHVTVALNGDGGDEAFGGYQDITPITLADLPARAGYVAPEHLGPPFPVPSSRLESPHHQKSNPGFAAAVAGSGDVERGKRCALGELFSRRPEAHSLH